jgi:hypothetical protein
MIFQILHDMWINLENLTNNIPNGATIELYFCDLYALNIQSNHSYKWNGKLLIFDQL